MKVFVRQAKLATGLGFALDQMRVKMRCFATKNKIKSSQIMRNKHAKV